MLTNEDTAVDGHYVVLGESLLQLAPSLLIILRLTIGGHEDGSVDDEEVGISGRKAMTVVGVVDGRRHGERDKAEARC